MTSHWTASVTLINLGNPQYSFFFPPRYGNWCGPRWSGGFSGGPLGSGEPVDDLDLACKLHDLGYISADTYWKPIYDAAALSARSAVCGSWRAAYRSNDDALRARTFNLPDLNTNSTPDTWNYDPRVFGPHPWNANSRINFQTNIITFDLLRGFAIAKDPPC
jgi:hypothetical protein